MDFSFLGIVNRVLAMSKLTTVSALTTSSENNDYKVQWCVNDTLQDLANLLRIKKRMITFSFPTVAGQRVYPVPKQVMFPLYALRQKETGVKLTFMDTNLYDLLLPNDTSSGDPLNYYIESFGGSEYQPDSGGEQISIVSSNAGDTTKTVIQGYDVSGNYLSEEVTLTGTSAGTSVNTYKTVERISKSKTFGYITYSTALTGTLSILNPNETQSMIQQIGLYPIPSSVITIYGRAWAKIPSLVYANEVPIGVDESHINAVVFGAYARFLRYDPKNLAETINAAFGLYEKEIMKILDNDARNPDSHPRMKSSREMVANLDWARPINRTTP